MTTITRLFHERSQRCFCSINPVFIQTILITPRHGCTLQNSVLRTLLSVQMVCISVIFFWKKSWIEQRFLILSVRKLISFYKFENSLREIIDDKKKLSIKKHNNKLTIFKFYDFLALSKIIDDRKKYRLLEKS